MSNPPPPKKNGTVFSDNDLLNNIASGSTMVALVDFNILWLIQSGPTALLTGCIVIISVTSCSLSKCVSVKHKISKS
jgi:hypothetical protein